MEDPEMAIRKKQNSHPSFLLVAKFVCFVSVVILFSGCQPSPQKASPVTIVLVDQGWLSKEFREWHEHEFRDFARETGVQVELSPSPETAVDQLALWEKLLASGSATPDVYAIDVIWPKQLSQYLVDLSPYLSASDRAKYFPSLLMNDTVDGKLVAIPSRTGSGMLFYRTDLLQRYGYKRPPQTWDELEKMAAKIQTGERARGNKNFWGYLWEGAPSEALTCNALEWQASEGGGKIIEDDHTVSVNNPQAIRAWKRAAHWVGTISPPGVLAYKEWDAMNIWQSGNAAFMRNWTAAYVASRGSDSMVRNKFDATVLPRGQAGHAAVLGGLGYGVSRSSRHLKEAVALALFLSRANTQVEQSRIIGEPPTIMSLYHDPELVSDFPYWKLFTPEYVQGLVSRPALVTRAKYIDVSEAYFQTVHAVLAGQKDAATAAAELEKQLMQITGFPKGEPQRSTFSEKKIQ